MHPSAAVGTRLLTRMGSDAERNAQFELRFWGVRGSYPTPGLATARIGGNSVCMEVQVAGVSLVFDAGTGLIALGQKLVREHRRGTVHVFLSHYHHDHIEGLRFFQPVYDRNWRTIVYGPALPGTRLRQVLSASMAPPFFPVAFDELPGRVELRSVAHENTIQLGAKPPVRVGVFVSRAHPKLGVALYRVDCAGRSVVYATDIESARGGLADVVHLARGADVLVHDAQYTDAEYRDAVRSRVGWGHSTVAMACEAARQAGVRQLVLYHHDPSHDDRLMRTLAREARRLFPASIVAREGLALEVA